MRGYFRVMLDNRPTMREFERIGVTGEVLTARAAEIDAATPDFAQTRSKFASLDDMSRALEAALRTPTGQAALQRLRPGMREPTFTVDIQHQFLVSAVVDGGGATTFGPREFGAAGIHRLPCTLVLEGRERAGTPHLHIQTFYPKLDAAQVEKLLAAK